MRPGGRERPNPSPVVMAINLFLSSNRDNLSIIYEDIFTVPDSIPSEVTRSRNQEVQSSYNSSGPIGLSDMSSFIL